MEFDRVREWLKARKKDSESPKAEKVKESFFDSIINWLKNNKFNGFHFKMVGPTEFESVTSTMSR